MSQDPPARRRERSHRYPGVPLPEAIEFARSIGERGLDGLPAESIAAAMGYKNIKTQSFSASLSAARQFGLLEFAPDGYALTDLARAILYPVDPSSTPALRRKALKAPPLYAELAVRLAGRRVPEPSALANLLYHHYHITAAAKDQAAEAFLASARFAGALGSDGTFRPEGDEVVPADPPPAAPASRPAHSPPSPPRPARRRDPSGVRIDLKLWGADEGKMIRIRAPEVIGRESFERFLQAFRLHVRIEDDGSPGRS